MPRGRPAAPKAPTKFLNAKRRVIFMTSNGKFIAKSEKGATIYNPKARHVKSPGGTVRSLTNSGARVPTAIRAKAVRKVRANRGKARGPRAYKTGMLQTYARAIGPKRPAGRPRKHMVSPKAGYGLDALYKSPGMGPVARRHKAAVARKRKALMKKLMAPLK
jgi:hypothetical protein